MNRRDFTKSLAAAFAVPALPAKAFATAPVAASSAVMSPFPYTYGAMLARTQGQISVDVLMSKMQIDVAQATSVFNRLIANNVVGSANVVGLAKANPIARPNAILRAGLDHLTKDAIEPQVDATDQDDPDTQDEEAPGCH